MVVCRRPRPGVLNRVLRTMVPVEDRIARTTGTDSVKPICLLISGGAGTGKSTIALLSTYFLRERIGETAALSTDEFYRMFDPAGHRPTGTGGGWPGSTVCLPPSGFSKTASGLS
jgi:pantothenate kinase-related protein Tda10